jgi:AraC-like DNA-binding protein
MMKIIPASSDQSSPIASGSLTCSQGQLLSYASVNTGSMKIKEGSLSRLHTIRDWLTLARKGGFRATYLARDCGVSLRQLERFFLTKAKMTPEHWLNSLRQREAIALIIQGRSIKEVAFDLGYKQTSHFSREFKRAHGIAPSSVRSQSSSPHDVAYRYEMSRTDTSLELNVGGNRVSL